MSVFEIQNTATAAVALATCESTALGSQSPSPAVDEPVDLERETLRHTISELRSSLKALVECEINSQSNHHARLQFEKTNSYARVYVSKDESTLLSLEKHELQQAMQRRISTSILAVNTRPVCPPLELCGLDETGKSSVTGALEMKSRASRHPFSDLEPADLLRLTPYYLPYYLGGIDPHPQGWRENLGVFPPGYPDEVRSYIYLILTATSLTVTRISRTRLRKLFKPTKFSLIY